MYRELILRGPETIPRLICLTFSSEKYVTGKGLLRVTRSVVKIRGPITHRPVPHVRSSQNSRIYTSYPRFVLVIWLPRIDVWICGFDYYLVLYLDCYSWISWNFTYFIKNPLHTVKLQIFYYVIKSTIYFLILIKSLKKDLI